MIISVFPKNWVLGYSWSTLLWYWCYYPHGSRDALSPVCGTFYKVMELVRKGSAINGPIPSSFYYDSIQKFPNLVAHSYSESFMLFLIPNAYL